MNFLEQNIFFFLLFFFSRSFFSSPSILHCFCCPGRRWAAVTRAPPLFPPPLPWVSIDVGTREEGRASTGEGGPDEGNEVMAEAVDGDSERIPKDLRTTGQESASNEDGSCGKEGRIPKDLMTTGQESASNEDGCCGKEGRRGRDSRKRYKR